MASCKTINQLTMNNYQLSTTKYVDSKSYVGCVTAQVNITWGYYLNNAVTHH